MTEEQRQLAEIARAFLSAAPGPRATLESGYSADTWDRAVEEQGWTALCIPEEHDGFGFGMAELGLCFEELGRHLTGIPLLGSSLATFAVLECGTDVQKGDWLPSLAAGLRATVALDGAISAARNGDAWVLSGAKLRVADLAGTDVVIVVTDEGLFWVPTGLVTPQPVDGLDPTRPLANILLSNVRIPEAGRMDRAGFERFQARAWTVLAFEQVGLADAALDQAVDYAKVRQQFGKPIGSFQAVKHMCADMLLQVESARSAAYAAAEAIDSNDPGLLDACRAARIYCTDAAMHCGGQNIQVHGGIGFTWEHDAHFFFKRARANQALLGEPRAHRETLSASVLAGAAPLPEFDISSDDEAFREEVRGWLEDNLTGEFAELRGRGWAGDMDGAVEGRRAWEKRLGEGRWTGLTWPVELGGRGATLAQEVIFLEEYTRANAPGRVGHIGEGLLGPTIIAFGTDEQKKRFLPPILDGSELWCQGYSEPGAGSDLANVQCRAEMEDGRWKVNGQKVWTSLAEISEWCFSLCRTSMFERDAPKKHRGISCLLIPMDQPGVSIVPIEQITGGSEFAEVWFDNAETAAENVVGDIDGGWRVAMGTLSFERGASTLAQQLSFANELGQVLTAAKRTGAAQDPVVRQQLAQAWLGLRIMRLNALRTLNGHHDGTLSREALITKLYWANWHRDLGELALDVLGPEALTEKGPLERLFLWTRCDTIYAGTNEIQRNIIGERGLGLPR
ncbi:MAG: acyl-CoA dehydrogenase [Proteobacteria bacterium]|nr:acyl-CoA dehydrogenase [Pseudomonadota bacterium]MCP4922113.1 acyl-CoA dehydrogenase [Pseudomonadota bacterium]